MLPNIQILTKRRKQFRPAAQLTAPVTSDSRTLCQSGRAPEAMREQLHIRSDYRMALCCRTCPADKFHRYVTGRAIIAAINWQTEKRAANTCANNKQLIFSSLIWDVLPYSQTFLPHLTQSYFYGFCVQRAQSPHMTNGRNAKTDE